MATVLEYNGYHRLVSHGNEKFEITICRSSTDFITISKELHELTQLETNTIIGELLKQQKSIINMEDLKTILIESLKKAKKDKFYLTNKDIIKTVNETVNAWESTLPVGSPSNG